MARVRTWLDYFFGPWILRLLGVEYPQRPVLELEAGDGVDIVAVDVPSTDATKVTISASGGSAGAGTILNAGTGTLNNVASTVTGANAFAIRFSGAAPVVTGVANGADRRVLFLEATGGPLVISHDSGSSSATNRILTDTGADVTIPDESSAILIYDPTSSRWRLLRGAYVVEATPIANASTGNLDDVVSTSSGLPATGIRFSGAAPVVRGIASGAHGRKLVIFATGGRVTLAHENAGSTAANRITTSSGVDAIVDNGAAVQLVYDGTSSRWRLSDKEVPVLANASTGNLDDVVTTTSGNDAAGLRFSGAAPVVRGLASGRAGRRLYVMTTGGSLVVANENSNSVAANRIITGTGADVTIADEETVLFVYDATSSRWRMFRSGTATGITPGNRGEVYETFDTGSGPAVRWGLRALAALANASTGNLDNVATVDANSNPVGAIRFSGAAPVLRGLAGGADNRQLDLITTGGPLQINNEDANSTAANRIITGTGGNVTIADESTASVVYDAASSRWRLKLGAAPEITPGANNTVATSNGSAVVWQTIVDANVNASAAIARTKLQLLSADGDVFMRTAGANASGKIADANVATSAAIASSKIAATNGQVAYGASSAIAFHSGLTYDGAGFLATTAIGLNGGTQHTTGRIRMPYPGASEVILLGIKNSGGSDARILGAGAGDQMTIGDVLLDMTIRTFGALDIVGAAGYARLDSTKFGIAKPVAGSSGDSVPYRGKSASINTTGGVTLTPSQYECLIWIFTGTAGTVTAPSSTGGMALCRNDTGGAVTVKRAAQTGVSLLSTQAQWMFDNGTDWVKGGAAA